MAEINNKFLGEVGAAKLVHNIKDNFSTIDHTHTAEEIGADKAGSAVAALTLAKKYTEEQLATITTGDIVVKESEHSSSADTATNAVNAENAISAENAKEAEHAISADNATTADTATKAYQDGNGNVITDTYETKVDASAKLEEAKLYADQIKSDILGGAPKETLDTIAELATAFEENAEVIEALDSAITNKADKEHVHSWNDLEDRPFYEGIENKVFLDNTFVLEEISNYGSTTPGIKLADDFVIDGEIEYTITINDMVKTCNPMATEYDDGVTRYDIINTSGDYWFTISYETESLNSYAIYFLNRQVGDTLSVKIENPKSSILKQIDEKFIPDTIARVSELPEQVQADYFETDKTSKAYIKNKPMRKEINQDVYSKIETLNVGNYCLVDFNVMSGLFQENLRYENLIKKYNRTFDYYFAAVMKSSSTRMEKRIGDTIKDLDGTNCYLVALANPVAYAELYMIHDRELLSDELKEKITNNGVWLIVTGEEAVTKYRDFEFIEYMYLQKLDENLLPKTVVFKSDLEGYVSEDKLSESLTNLENDLLQSIPEGFSGSWNDLTDKPFGKEITAAYECTLDSNHEYNTVDANGRKLYYICSDLVFTGYTCIIETDYEGNKTVVMNEYGDSGWVCFTHHVENDVELYVYSVMRAGTYDGITFPVMGTYTTRGYVDGFGSFIYDIVSISTVNLQKIDEEYLPDDLARTSNILTQANQNSSNESYSPAADSDLVTKIYVDSLVPTTDDALALVAEVGFVEPVVNNGYVLTDANGVIYTI